MKQVLITGAGGYIGAILAKELITHGYKVIAFDRYFFGVEVLRNLAGSSQLVIRRGDIRDITERDLEGVHAVCDLAALSNDPSGELAPELTLSINHWGRAAVARNAKKASVARYILSSSCSVYGRSSGDADIDEAGPTAPVTTYAAANLNAEQDILPLADSHFCATALRNATVFGVSPRMRFDLVVNQMTLNAVRTGRITVMGGGNQWRPHIHVRDVAKAFRVVIEAPQSSVNGSVFNVGAENAQINTVAARIRKALPNPIQIDDDGREVPDRRDYKVSFEKMARTLGFVANITIEQGAREIYDALSEGNVESGLKTTTVSWYRNILEAQQLVEAVALNGRVL